MPSWPNDQLIIFSSETLPPCPPCLVLSSSSQVPNPVPVPLLPVSSPPFLTLFHSHGHFPSLPVSPPVSCLSPSLSHTDLHVSEVYSDKSLSSALSHPSCVVLHIVHITFTSSPLKLCSDGVMGGIRSSNKMPMCLP